MYKLILLSFAVSGIHAAPGYPDFDFGHSPLFSGHSAPVFDHSPSLYAAHAEPVYSPAIYKSAPLIAHPPLAHVPAPIFKTYAAPVVKEVAPIIKYAQVQPIIKAPIVKSYAPATSFASVTSYQVAHAQPVVKAIVQPQPIIKTIYQPQPIIKSYIPEHSYEQDFSYGHGFH